jgi:hypothetical protein
MSEMSRPGEDSWQRVELKYAVSEATAQAARSFVLPFVAPDDAAKSGAGVRQQVTSLYLETAGADFYRCHLASQPDRFKLRVRSYGTLPGPSVYFEVKRKVGHVIDKRRARVPLWAMDGILNRKCTPTSELPAAERQHLHLFVWLMACHEARPRALTTCEREAYGSRQAGCTARVTLDRHMAFQAVSSATLTGHPRRWSRTPLEKGSVVLELKYSGCPPSWMRELALRLGRSRIAYSKYVAAMAAEMGEDGSRLSALGMPA